LTLCDQSCVGLQEDNLHCGRCDVACQGAAECTAGACKACATGCAVLATTVSDVSLTAAASYGVRLASPVDLSGTTIRARMYVASTPGTITIQLHYDDSTDPSSGGVSRGFEVPTSGWFAATLDVTGAQAFDTHVDWIDVKVGGFSSSGTATVYLDSLSIDPPAAGPWEFASSASPLVYANEGNVHPEFVSGAITWRNY
jgi:hypothetical protein